MTLYLIFIINKLGHCTLYKIINFYLQHKYNLNLYTFLFLKTNYYYSYFRSVVFLHITYN